MPVEIVAVLVDGSSSQIIAVENVAANEIVVMGYDTVLALVINEVLVATMVT